MKLITVEAVFAPADLQAAIILFQDQAQTVRGMVGCKHYVLYNSPSEDAIAIIQHWDTAEDFESYRASAEFSKLGAGLRPLMTIPPVTTIAEIDTI